jgi:hypothetical protein
MSDVKDNVESANLIRCLLAFRQFYVIGTCLTILCPVLVSGAKPGFTICRLVLHLASKVNLYGQLYA